MLVYNNMFFSRKSMYKIQQFFKLIKLPVPAAPVYPAITASTRLILVAYFKNTIVVQESGSVEVLARQSDLPILDISPMSVDYEVDISFNDIDFEYESNENAKDTVDIDAEEVDTECLYENMFSNSSMPENPVHRFIATFTVLFASHYVVNKGAVFLIELAMSS
ncbi:hypothetical protein PHYBLDRAFT_169877 [Phycomyces blakesleeanus NRRL 1555(-)]|uniref:Uncharacterized protein n=1 Tax=Phycomyces blakesleeanus (strain ATCC 8743b / DSM 1359 / FGSC 10004 / NBRC 33097 / NRRL 1555) TaxID=763407 RepID=A0A162PQG3_PHYB8|nr:hypothetical protein PHYBLDRAFT_169877 [Phycomyces blakesleeanus NRRL 1555(-)]OAD71966.1 hypothetical protein PHYBLDRAFT_169877 [Phycomyces blakesleeanus NRRL 1555(-)]|eukprot:XP_018290006.1 hypothetical protein PHYBLDRAFT_169877 [Phycomyces blakesleeanus NRRL 1555(-)]